jgi:ESCRT-II complex subunit VPS36
VTATDRKSRPLSEWVRATVHADHCKIAFDHNKDAVERVAQMLQDIVTAGAWKSVAVAASKKYGVGARVAREKKEIEKSETSIKEAFKGDLEELKSRAKQMVALSEAFTARLKKGEVSDADTAEFQSYVVSLGISDPVTKKACGGSENKFHRELAVELGRFLAEPIEKSKGMMQLQDVYCLYNRARGTMLISPDDLVAAAELFEVTRVPLSLRTFDSGVKVIQASTQSDAAIAERISALLEETGSISPSVLAQREDISVTLAREMLLATERLGRVCRDDTVAGLAFFRNRFLTEG